jgi:hypothetical protein
MNVSQLSDHAQSVVAHERELVVQRLESLREKADNLRAQAEQVEDEASAQERLLRSMDEILGIACQLPLDTSNQELRGQQLREAAIRILRDKELGAEPVHYRDWYEFLAERGLRVAGKDPVAAFLTQISRAEDVESVRPRSGLYRLRAV